MGKVTFSHQDLQGINENPLFEKKIYEENFNLISIQIRKFYFQKKNLTYFFYSALPYLFDFFKSNLEQLSRR